MELDGLPKKQEKQMKMDEAQIEALKSRRMIVGQVRR